MDADLPMSLRLTLFTDAAHHIARAIVGRDCGFAALAVSVITVAQMNAPARALATGGVLNLLGGFVLLALAWRSPHRPMQRSELWRSMNPTLKLAPEQAFPVLQLVLRATYLRFAGIAAWAGAWFLAMAGLCAAYTTWRFG